MSIDPGDAGREQLSLFVTFFTNNTCKQKIPHYLN